MLPNKAHFVLDQTSGPRQNPFPTTLAQTADVRNPVGARCGDVFAALVVANLHQFVQPDELADMPSSDNHHSSHHLFGTRLFSIPGLEAMHHENKTIVLKERK